MLPTAPKRKRRPVISGQACAFGGKDSVKENRQGCLSRFIRTQTGPLRRLCAPQCTKKKKTPKGVFFFLVRKMGLEPTRHRHTHLKRACLPIPALPQIAFDCKKDSSTFGGIKSSPILQLFPAWWAAVKSQHLFLCTVPKLAKIV